MRAPDAALVRALVEAALGEDGSSDDTTTDYLDIGARAVRASIVARAEGVMAGIDIAGAVFHTIDPETRFEPLSKDGDAVVPGRPVVSLEGGASAILAAERVALNFLQRLSGIATLTARFVAAVAGTGIRILDTRKTTPLHRELERFAVRAGGGANHRFNLSDMILVKENHLRSIGGIDALRRRLEKRNAPVEVEVEVDGVEALHKLAGAPVDRVMLDNFTPDDVRRAVDVVSRSWQRNSRPRIEVSGGVALHNISYYCIDGVDDISIGALTHSAPALDLSLEVESDRE